MSTVLFLAGMVGVLALEKLNDVIDDLFQLNNRQWVELSTSLII